MTMTTSMSRSSSLTITDTRQIASKMGADLRNLNTRTGNPALHRIPDYVEEAAQYLKAGYLDEVMFGFKDGDEWVLRLRYRALSGGYLSDGAPGGLPNVDVSDYPFHSFLKSNLSFALLPDGDRRAFEAGLPIQRSLDEEPKAIGGITGNNASYSRSGVGLGRDVWQRS